MMSMPAPWGFSEQAVKRMFSAFSPPALMASASAHMRGSGRASGGEGELIDAYRAPVRQGCPPPSVSWRASPHRLCIEERAVCTCNRCESHEILKKCAQLNGADEVGTIADLHVVACLAGGEVLYRRRVGG